MSQKNAETNQKRNCFRIFSKVLGLQLRMELMAGKVAEEEEEALGAVDLVS